MGFGVGLILIAVGAILAWAIHVDTSGFNITRSATSCSSSVRSAFCFRSSSGRAGPAPATGASVGVPKGLRPCCIVPRRPSTTPRRRGTRETWAPRSAHLHSSLVGERPREAKR
jgi:hypothetical protein